jgi:hypothetical protein
MSHHVPSHPACSRSFQHAQNGPDFIKAIADIGGDIGSQITTYNQSTLHMPKAASQKRLLLGFKLLAMCQLAVDYIRGPALHSTIGHYKSKIGLKD